MKRSIMFLAIMIVLTQTAFAEIVTKSIEYKDGDTVLEGYLAYDDWTDEVRPGVLVVHEWTGLGDYAKRRAEELAELGVVAFAIDMYGKGVYAKTHEEAAKLSGVYQKDRSLMRGRAKAGLDVLLAQDLVDPEQVAAIGYCFGGTTVLEMARAGFDLKGVVSFHGGLSTPVPAKPGDIKAKVLVLHGADEKFVTREDVLAFQDEMRKAKADWQMVFFGGAVHSFTVPSAGDDPSTGRAYNEQADERSWLYMMQFFDEIFEDF